MEVVARDRPSPYGIAPILEIEPGEGLSLALRYCVDIARLLHLRARHLLQCQQQRLRAEAAVPLRLHRCIELMH